MLRPSKRVFQLGVAVVRAETEIRQSLSSGWFKRLAGGAEGERFDAGPRGRSRILFDFNQRRQVEAGGAKNKQHLSAIRGGAKERAKAGR